MSCISRIGIKVAILWKKRWASEVICFCKYGLVNAVLLKCLRSPVSEHLRTVNMLKGPKESFNLHGSLLSYFLITLKVNQLENFVFSSILNLETVCWRIHTRWQAFSLCKSECLMQLIQMELSPNRKIFSEFFSGLPDSAWNWEYFEKKDESQTLFVSDIIDYKKWGYLNAQKAQCQNTYGQWTC